MKTAIIFSMFLFSDLVLAQYVDESPVLRRGGMIDDQAYAFIVKFPDQGSSFDFSSEPEIDLKQVTDIASRELAFYTEKAENYEISSVEITKVGSFDAWYYLVTFSEKRYVRKNGWGSFSIPVLLDGTPVKGKKLSRK